MEYLSVQQVTADGSATNEICDMQVADGAFNQISRMPFKFRKDDQPLQAGDVMIDLMDADFNLIGDSPLVIPPHSAVWLLGTFFKVSKKVVKKIKAVDRDFVTD